MFNFMSQSYEKEWVLIYISKHHQKNKNIFSNNKDLITK